MLALLIGRHHKVIVAIIATVFVVFLFSVKNTHSVTGCKNMQASILIVDESGENKLSGSSVSALPDSPFKKYVVTISQHILPKIEESAQCRENLKSPPEVKLVFVYRPLVASPKSLIKEPFELKQPPNTFKHLDSPWAKLAISSSPKLVMNAVFVWSERQFLSDQAVLSDASTSITNPLLPIDDQLFGKFVRDYTESVLLAASPGTRSSAQVSISERLPKDILWLFRHAWQSTRGPFGGFVLSALDNATKQMTDKYVYLTEILLNHHFSSERTNLHYDSILSLKDLLPLDKYRINKLH
jgi:hypothetical protein